MYEINIYVNSDDDFDFTGITGIHNKCRTLDEAYSVGKEYLKTAMFSLSVKPKYKITDGVIENYAPMSYKMASDLIVAAYNKLYDNSRVEAKKCSFKITVANASITCSLKYTK